MAERKETGSLDPCHCMLSAYLASNVCIDRAISYGVSSLIADFACGPLATMCLIASPLNLAIAQMPYYLPASSFQMPNLSSCQFQLPSWTAAASRCLIANLLVNESKTAQLLLKLLDAAVLRHRAKRVENVSSRGAPPLFLLTLDSDRVRMNVMTELIHMHERELQLLIFLSINLVHVLDLLESATYDTWLLIDDLEEREMIACIGFFRDGRSRWLHASDVLEDCRVEHLDVEHDDGFLVPVVGRLEVFADRLRDMATCADAYLCEVATAAETEDEVENGFLALY